MNTTTLNMTTLDGGVIIKRGEGGGATINNQDKVVDITENGTTEVVADGGYTGLGKVTINTEVGGAKPKWTGHADAEGLKAIGWTDEDIAYYQENGVNWNEEDDEWHKVRDDNKALYGVLTADNIADYKDRIVYLPKIDTSNVTSMNSMFSSCYSLTAIPMLNTSKVTSMTGMFQYCYSLTTIPLLDTSNVTDIYGMFVSCIALTTIPLLDLSLCKNINSMFENCRALTHIPLFDTKSAKQFTSTFSNCIQIVHIPAFNMKTINNIGNLFDGCYNLKDVYLDKMVGTYSFTHSKLLTKESILHMINNNAATSQYNTLTIKLASYTYDKWATDPDVVAALANHPYVSISK